MTTDNQLDQLSDDDKKLFEELIKSISQAEEANNILLDLLDSKDLDLDLPKFRENCQKYFTQKFNLELFNSSGNLARIASLPMNNNDVTVALIPVGANFRKLAEKLAEVTKTTSNALKNSADIIKCRQDCEHDPNSQECKDCQRILNKGK
ncbi:hypothetical protein [Dolichospermum compactum]|uniref:Uncharacterized protein n=1 Tax=Dolichospermum compactum NIES-806 TaxID=1973481 RepID=A0A1Z4VBA2_9CYAN|nr:hypothetical protein [Dolichospermum compactum]BAZ88485.1 hypothetical protein NIES806_47230 [Dolichospermum compactum NIES-806]